MHNPSEESVFTDIAIGAFHCDKRVPRRKQDVKATPCCSLCTWWCCSADHWYY